MLRFSCSRCATHTALTRVPMYSPRSQPRRGSEPVQVPIACNHLFDLYLPGSGRFRSCTYVYISSHDSLPRGAEFPNLGFQDLLRYLSHSQTLRLHCRSSRLVASETRARHGMRICEAGTATRACTSRTNPRRCAGRRNERSAEPRICAIDEGSSCPCNPSATCSTRTLGGEFAFLRGCAALSRQLPPIRR